MDIFESLENLQVSEACFEDIIGLVDEILSEGRLPDESLEQYKNRLLKDQLKKQGDKYYSTLTKLVYSDKHDSKHGKKESDRTKKIDKDNLKALSNYRKVMDIDLKKNGFEVKPDNRKTLETRQGEDFVNLKHELRQDNK